MLLDFLFGRKNAPPPPPPAPEAAAEPPAHSAPGTQIHFHPDLVAQLKADHQALLATFGKIKAAFQGGDLVGASAALLDFRNQLLAHLLKENVRFYIYLEHALAGDPDSHALVHHFRHEMDGIGKAVMAFLDKYRHLATDDALAAGFGADLDAVGGVLVQRIRSEEETLYPLYLPAY